MANHLIDKSFIISTTNQGIVLNSESFSHEQNRVITVDDMLNLPCCVYFSNCDSQYQLSNETCANVCGFDSPAAARDKSLLNTAFRKSAAAIFKNDQTILLNNRKEIIEENLLLRNGHHEHGFSLKMPWYNQHHEIVGLFGITIVSGKQQLSEALSNIAAFGLLKFNNPVIKKEYLPSIRTMIDTLTPRENECLQWLLKGKSAKIIAENMQLSSRTIEIYINAIKKKFSCRTKLELMAMLNMNSHTN